jgi:hypothetical protein
MCHSLLRKGYRRTHAYRAGTLAVGAGFSRVQIVTQTRIIRFASAASYVRIQLTATPLASLLRHQGERSIRQLEQALIADVAAALQGRRRPGISPASPRPAGQHLRPR